MNLGYYSDNTKNLFAASSTVDESGNLYLKYICSLGKILKFNKQLEKIEEINLSQKIGGGIYSTAQNEFILEGAQIFIIDEKGNLVHQFPSIIDRFDRNQKTCLFPVYKLSNGKILLMSNATYGNILAVSKKEESIITLNLPIESNYLTDTFSKQFNSLELIFDMDIDKSIRKQTIGERLNQIRTTYHTISYKMTQVLELSTENIAYAPTVSTNQKQKSE